MATSLGCWTCRLRRKKCDKRQPICETCSGLRITCHFNPGKPEWMDGGKRQEEMLQELKREVKEKAPWRRVDVLTTDKKWPRAVLATNGLPSPQTESNSQTSLADASSEAISGTSDTRQPPLHDVCGTPGRGAPSFGQGDSVLVMFYINHVFPFEFPLYNPRLADGGSAWVLDMMVHSAVFRHTTLCQGTFFFCLAQGVNPRSTICETVFLKVKEALGCLAQASEAMNVLTGVGENLRAVVHLMTSMVQVMRFEIATLTFENCHAHLNGALALFEQMMQIQGEVGLPTPNAHFRSVMDRLGPSAWIPPADHIKMRSTEQAALSFSAGLLLFDDVVASTVLQRRPRLLDYHEGLLREGDGDGIPFIDLQAVIGCKAWVITQIGQIAALDEWKQQARSAGRLNVMELVTRAVPIKESLESRLQELEHAQVHSNRLANPILDLLKVKGEPHNSIHVVTSIWAYAALAYLSTVVSGCQPGNAEVQHYVGKVINMISSDLDSPDIIRAVVWPFCVAGCLAEQQYEPVLRNIVTTLRPQIVFGTARKALQIMESVWSNRKLFINADLAACFRSQDEMVLLV
ncbi:hypothetical protein CC79DRAFT_1335459 [Sarocladium strictum]